MNLTKDEALSLAITVGAHIERNSCNSEMLTSFTEHELLAFANAIDNARMERDAKICEALSMNCGTPKYRAFCEDAIRATKESPEDDLEQLRRTT